MINRSYGADMHAEDMAEDFPVVTIDTNALDAARMLAEHRLPGIIVTDDVRKAVRGAARLTGGAIHRAAPISRTIRRWLV